MVSWEVRFFELPHINNITIQDEDIRLYTFQVVRKLCGMATISAQVGVRNNNNI